jgi:pentatricopeptide repeat protein
LKEQVLPAFDSLFDALLKRGDADEAVSLFADEDVVFWGSGREEQALDREALARLFGAIRSATRSASIGACAA